MIAQGVWTAVITPFDSSGEIDWSAFKRILKDQRDAGINGVVICGTTGESPTLSESEKKKLIETAVSELQGGKTQVLAGTGGNSTRETVAFSKWASSLPVAGLLVVTPYYNKPSQAGLKAHFTAIADECSKDIMLYNVPGRTGVSFTAETVAELAAHPKIRAIKEATGNTAFTSEIRDALKAKNQKMDIFSGDDPTYLALLEVGAVGIVSVASNLFPRGMLEIQKAFLAGDSKRALELHQKFFPLFRDLFIESNPGPIKEAMYWAGFCEPGLRLPLVRVTPANWSRLEKSLAACGLKKGTPA